MKKITDIFKKYNKKSIILAGICILVSLFILINLIVKINNINAAKYSSADFNMSGIPFIGYELNDGAYISTTADGQFIFPEVNIFIYSIVLYFETNPGLNITVHYANESHPFNEETAKLKTTNSTAVEVTINDYVSIFRVDVGDKEGESFKLLNVTINEPDLVKKEKQLAVFKELVTAVSFIIFILIFFLIFIKKAKPEYVSFAAVFLLSVIYMFVITPASPPDEPYHVHNSYKLSNIMTFSWDNIDEGDVKTLDRSSWRGHRNSPVGYINIMDNLFQQNKADSEIFAMGSTNNVYLLQYVPQAVGVTIGRLLNLNATAIFYLGRFGNILFFGIIVFFAVKTIPRYKYLLTLISILPMSLHQAASYSYDAYINGMCLLILAYIIKLIFVNEKIKKKEYIILFILFAVLAPAKYLYTVFAVFLFIIPKERYNSNKDYWIKTLSIATTAVIVMLLSYVYVMKTTEPSSFWIEGASKYTMSFVINQPLTTANIFIRTIVNTWSWYLNTCIGSSLSGLTMNISGWIINAFIVLLALNIFSHENNCDAVPFKVRIICLITSFAIFFGVMFSMFIGWTPDNSNIILGVQGRYYLPIVLPLTIACGNKILVYKRNIEKAVLITAVFLNVCIITEVLNKTILL